MNPYGIPFALALSAMLIPLFLVGAVLAAVLHLNRYPRRNLPYRLANSYPRHNEKLTSTDRG